MVPAQRIPLICMRTTFDGFIKYVIRKPKPVPSSSYLDHRRTSTNIAIKPRALKIIKPRATTHREIQFIDWKRVQVIGGNGGNGAICFLQLYGNPTAGPSGGDGGHGGHLIFEVDFNVKSLTFGSILRASHGENGRHKNMNGANAEHTIVKVPSGTLIKNMNDELLGELVEPGVKFVAARGGTGGKGNAFFLSNTNRHPNVAELGAEGEDHVLNLELRTMAHAGLVGFPNVGKSTLLRAISRARPEVASYPFTTLNPHVGIVHYEDYIQISVADLPGLVEGAHRNEGLGFAFLKHIERCACLLFVIDASLDSPLDQVTALKHELEMYQKGLSERPSAVIANKVDLPNAAENVRLIQEHLQLPIIAISAKKGTNISHLLEHLRFLYDKHGGMSYRW